MYIGFWLKQSVQIKTNQSKQSFTIWAVITISLPHDWFHSAIFRNEKLFGETANFLQDAKNGFSFFFFFAVVGLTKIRMFLSYLLSIISHHGEQEWGYPLPFLGKLCILTCWSSQGNETHYIYFLLCKSLTSSSYLQIVFLASSCW